MATSLLCDASYAASSFEPVLHKHCLAALDLGAGVEQTFDCFIVQNRQAVQSMRRSMDWTLEDNMVDGLFFCATLSGRRGPRGPYPISTSRSGNVRHRCGGG